MAICGIIIMKAIDEFVIRLLGVAYGKDYYQGLYTRICRGR